MKAFYKIQNKSKDSADILIYEQIGKGFFDEGVGAEEFVKDLKGLNVGTINLHINSPGGSVFDGNAIYNALLAHKATVNVKVDGIAASIASVIAMAGDSIEMPENAMMMIHDPFGLVMGNAEDMRKRADALDKIKVGIVAAYARKTGMEDDALDILMTDETWMTAEEAVEMGFADKVLAPVEAQANFDLLAQFENVPTHFMAGVTGKEGDMGDHKDQKSPDITLDYLRAEHPAIVSDLLAQGRKEGKEAELNRIKAVYEQMYPGHEEIVKAAMFDGESDAGKVAMDVLAAEREVTNKAGKDLSGDAPAPVDEPAQEPQPKAKIDGNLPLAEQCKQAWDGNVDGVRDEFGDLDEYVAFMEANKTGLVKIQGGN